MSMDMHQIDPMRFSANMQQNLLELQEHGEYDSDVHLVYIVRIQRLCERISHMRSRDEDEELDAIIGAPTSAYLAGYKAELDKLQANMPSHLQDNVFLKVRMATARLRLHEPPNIDAELLASLSKSLDSLSSGSTLALDAFYQSNVALKSWFDTWLSIPVEAFYTMPLSLAFHMIYGVVMINRWAWLAARSSASSNPKFDAADPSDNNPNDILVAMETAINLDPPASSSNPSSSSKDTPPWATPDENLPHVLSALKAQLSTQPDLTLDVADYVERVIAQLKSVDMKLKEWSVDSGPWRGNIWTLGATKVKIAQLRQKRWAEMVASEIREREQERQGDVVDGMGEIDMQESFLATLQVPEWDVNMLWGPNYFDPGYGDPSFWMNLTPEEGDWASVGMVNMNPPEQFSTDSFM
ncbi:hypothetical protein CCHL11_07974 [Colletotrichum chlorophyti]|uniref:Uncharacterized protein n=1 Tax=Colletotrichum chlorophyti TaxID=708187 RepID=A0A1Q8RM68_9PEZI|nr:hypothetical protein CCHL11_07974 [Colletotrichum chlorophyti]